MCSFVRFPTLGIRNIKNLYNDKKFNSRNFIIFFIVCNIKYIFVCVRINNKSYAITITHCYKLQVGVLFTIMRVDYRM